MVEAGALQGLKALVVDDQIDGYELIQFVLETEGMVVACAATVSEALRIHQSVKPDIVISDISMPYEDGYELIQQLRALSPEEGGQTPAIALTAHVMGDARSKALKAGYQEFITKPVDVDELVLAITQLLNLQNKVIFT